MQNWSVKCTLVCKDYRLIRDQYCDRIGSSTKCHLHICSVMYWGNVETVESTLEIPLIHVNTCHLCELYWKIYIDVNHENFLRQCDMSK